MTLKAITGCGNSVSLRLAKHRQIDLRRERRSNGGRLLRHVNVDLLRFWQRLIERQSFRSQFLQAAAERFIRQLQKDDLLLIGIYCFPKIAVRLLKFLNIGLISVKQIVRVNINSIYKIDLARKGNFIVGISKFVTEVKRQCAKLSVGRVLRGVLSEGCYSADHDENCNQVFHGKQYDFGSSLFQGTNVIASNSGVAR